VSRSDPLGPHVLTSFSGGPGGAALPDSFSPLSPAVPPYLTAMRIALLADFPVHKLPVFEGRQAGHHATWLPPLARELESRASDLDLHWITCTKEVESHTTLKAWNQTFHLLPRYKLSIEILTGFMRERSLIARVLQEIRPDIVHAWGTEQGYAYAANGFSGTSLISLQGILQICCKVATMPWLTRLQAFHESRALCHAKRLTVESPWGKSQLQHFAPQAQVDLLEYGTDSECFEITRQPSRKPSAVFLGSLTRLKGLDTLISAFSDPRLFHVDLEIYGAENPEFTQTGLPANIRFLGHRPRAEALASLSRAWCLVHPTRADTSPNCVKEARVIGLPVVTTPNGGQTQYVEHGKSGFIHAAGDIEGLIQGCLTVTASKETSINMGQHGQAECRAALNPATTANHLLEIYQRLR
jgi:glycosyltransferase involved in cell wall biosynthesis